MSVAILPASPENKKGPGCFESRALEGDHKQISEPSNAGWHRAEVCFGAELAVGFDRVLKREQG